jgi:nitrogen fixation protein NifU and related proteins
MDHLKDLYQEVIIDHNKTPRNKHAMPNASHKAEGYNPLCGDQFTVYLNVDNDNIIREVSFTGHGCAISTASASLMTEKLIGQSIEQAELLFHAFHQMITSSHAVNVQNLGKLAVLAGVREFPARVKCATLAWHAMHGALQHTDKPATTE